MFKVKLTRKNSKWWGPTLIVLVILGLSIFYYNHHTVPVAYPGNTNHEYSLEEIQRHTSATDCYTTIENNTYNISEYLRVHSSKPDLKGLCGTEADVVLSTGAFPNGVKPNFGFSMSVKSGEKQFSKFRIGSYSGYVPDSSLSSEQLQKMLKQSQKK